MGIEPVAGECGVAVNADRLLLRHAAMNILHNAIRYSLAGSKVSVRCFRRAAGAVIEIAHKGPGIAPEHQQKIFERFICRKGVPGSLVGGEGRLLPNESIAPLCGSFPQRVRGRVSDASPVS
ncbi:MAG TPA: ATP-binding protein [Candidatus Paceibacterota bacterium]|nr:ATP-binding protein [Candidatus Paceibacterota bacterium]